jgi:hypothetical protein
MAKSKVEELLKDIRVNLSQHSASAKDEVRVMTEMLNDPTYKVDEYGNKGKVGEYCPYEDARKLVSSIVASGAKVPVAEAKKIAAEYEFSKSEAASMIGISKEFINTYVQTTRKLPLGGREKMSASLSIKEVPMQKKKLPNNGLAASSKGGEIVIPAHNAIKSSSACPNWIRQGKK